MNKVNILVVDDRPDGLLAVQAVLDSPAYNIVTAASGGEALKHLLQMDFAVILMDVQMPIMNGFETASIIKTRDRSRDVPIIFMSAINQDEQYVYQGYGVGAVDYIMKPFDPYILRSKVSIFVDMFRKNQLIQEQAARLMESEAKAHAQEMDRLEIENLRRYQYLADSIPQIVFRLMPDGGCEYFNKVWFSYTGLSFNDCSGTKWRSVLHPEDLPYVLSLFKDINESGLECEARILNKDGEFRWHLFRILPEKYGQGEIKTWLGTATDIEDQKRNEETQKFLAEAGELLVSTLDYQESLEAVSNLAVPYLADWFAFDTVSAEGETTTIVLKHKEHDKLSEAAELHEKLFKEKDEVKDIVRKGKMQVSSGFIIIPLQIKGKSIGILTFSSSTPGKYEGRLKDTALELAKRVTLALENSNLYKLSQEAIEARNDFLSIASHELNTPITSLKLQLQLVKKLLQLNKDGEFPVERFEKSIAGSVKQVDRLINLVQVLLDVSRIQAGKLNFNFEKLKARDLLNEVLERHKEMVENSESEVFVDCPDDILAVWDKTRIEQVVINLLANAVKYAPGKIELSFKQENDDVVFTIRDHGEGIPPEKLKNIFDRFERATDNSSISGLGLGLYIVKQIVEGHNGRIEVASKTNEGTSFKVYLPKDAGRPKAQMNLNFAKPSSPMCGEACPT